MAQLRESPVTTWRVWGMGMTVFPKLPIIIAIVPASFVCGEEFNERSAICAGVIWDDGHWPLAPRGCDFPDRSLPGFFVLVVFAILLAYNCACGFRSLEIERS